MLMSPVVSSSVPANPTTLKVLLFPLVLENQLCKLDLCA
jgi:hypothetical protein